MIHQPDSASSQLTAIIADEDNLARQQLHKILTSIPEVTLLGEAKTCEEARALIARTNPSLIFTEVLLSGGTGFELLHPAFAPRAIFVTRHSDYAVRAFEMGAADYILKPVSSDRVRLALSRCQTETSSVSRPAARGKDVLIVPVGRSFAVVAIHSIACILAESNYSRLKLTNGRELYVYRTLSQWEQYLPEEAFVRLDRSTTIAIAQLDSVKVVSREKALLHLSGLTEPLVIGRTALARLRSLAKDRIPPGETGVENPTNTHRRRGFDDDQESMAAPGNEGHKRILPTSSSATLSTRRS